MDETTSIMETPCPCIGLSGGIMNRRNFMKQSSLSLVAVAAGCKTEGGTEPGHDASIIDAHCHVFNASDLPTARFLRQVVFDDFPKQSAKILAIRDPDVADEFYKVIVLLLGADKAPSADQENAYLTTGRHARLSAQSADNARQAAVEDTAQHLLELDRKSKRIISMNGLSDGSDRAPLAEEKFLNYMLGEPTVTLRADKEFSYSHARAASQRAFDGQGALARYLNWFSLFRLYRHVLVERLISDTEQQGFRPIMLTPALVDYDEWLYEDVDASPLPRQMLVMDKVSQRMAKKGAVVHGYMGFDPLREVAYRARKSAVSSLATTRAALTEHGFIGAKLYPPMGFRASGNSRPYPMRTVTALGFDPSKQLDTALEDLYRLCVELDAPILAHAAASNGSGPGYEKRGDPAYWIPVFQKFPSLRVCLAHFGSFDTKSAGREKMPLPQGSWEWRLGEFVKSHPRQNVVADISYFSEVLTANNETRMSLAASFRRWLTEFDPDCDHILYGSDWIMLGKEAGYNHYVESINAFLRSECRLSDDACDKIFWRNALRFLPLAHGSRGRDRLLAYYRRNGLDEALLPSGSPRLLAGLFGR
ncbi:amidohydrolase family protein [Mesorhizobium sp. VK4C]|uniref:amidohydrolase family protein n=1 Tax=Mesorhizobium captivum TaxID=3072319 RepID=UPI002A241003|nr:amidohydrolase family protein [Mesorhizobium sp. VK4C]MDX8502113.1 amidohydrolase family protein [Mesorhizobium sp. VK4C]